MVKHPKSLRAGDKIYAGTAVKGAVIATDGKHVVMAWLSGGLDTLPIGSPLWLFLHVEKRDRKPYKINT